jgi:hypothetical protein
VAPGAALLVPLAQSGDWALGLAANCRPAGNWSVTANCVTALDCVLLTTISTTDGCPTYTCDGEKDLAIEMAAKAGAAANIDPASDISPSRIFRSMFFRPLISAAMPMTNPFGSFLKGPDTGSIRCGPQAFSNMAEKHHPRHGQHISRHECVR